MNKGKGRKKGKSYKSQDIGSWSFRILVQGFLALSLVIVPLHAQTYMQATPPPTPLNLIFPTENWISLSHLSQFFHMEQSQYPPFQNIATSQNFYFRTPEAAHLLHVVTAPTPYFQENMNISQTKHIMACSSKLFSYCYSSRSKYKTWFSERVLLIVTWETHIILWKNRIRV